MMVRIKQNTKIGAMLANREYLADREHVNADGEKCYFLQVGYSSLSVRASELEIVKK